MNNITQEELNNINSFIEDQKDLSNKIEINKLKLQNYILSLYIKYGLKQEDTIDLDGNIIKKEVKENNES